MARGRRPAAALILAVICLGGMAAGCARGAAQVSAPPSPAVQRALAAAQSLKTTYDDPATGLLANVPPPSGSHYGTTTTGSLLGMAQSFQPTAMWGYSWALAALEDVAQLPGGSGMLPLVRTLTDHLARYWDPGAPVPGYAPTPSPGAAANKYFDDNAWAGLDLVTAYHLTGDPAYLRQAEAVFTYEESGWDAAGGGIWWDDAHQGRNTAANAPTAELAVYLYLDTHQATYLTWAKRIYAWEVAHLVDPVTGEVWDGLHGTRVTQTMWTYNQGDVIGAATLLYEATHDPTYLAQAKRTETFALAQVQPGNVLVPQAQFNGVLVDNLQLLYQVTRDPRIAALVTASANSAWSHARNADGLFGGNWLGPAVPDSQVPILTQSGAVRLLAVAASLAGGGFGALQL